MKELNKDFYDNLPGCVCEILEEIIGIHSKEKWFEKAWEEYRQHVLTNDMDNMKMPGYVFNKYINKDKENI